MISQANLRSKEWYPTDFMNKWYMHNPESVLEYETHKLLWDFEIQMDYLISTSWPDLVIVNKKRTWQIVDFAVPADHRVKLKESKKRGKYLDLVRELKKLCNMRVMVTPIMVGALGTVTKGLVQGRVDFKIKGQVKTIQTTALLRSARMLRRVLETGRELL